MKTPQGWIYELLEGQKGFTGLKRGLALHLIKCSEVTVSFRYINKITADIPVTYNNTICGSPFIQFEIQHNLLSSCR